MGSGLVVGREVEAGGRQMAVARNIVVVEALIADKVGVRTEQVDCTGREDAVEVVVAHTVDRARLGRLASDWNMNKNAVAEVSKLNVEEVEHTSLQAHWRNSSFPHLLVPGSGSVVVPWEWKNTLQPADGQQEMGGHSLRKPDFVGCTCC